MNSIPNKSEKFGLSSYLNFAVQLKQLTKNKSQKLVRPESVDFYLNTV